MLSSDNQVCIFKNTTFAYGETPIFTGLNFSVAHYSFVGITGENGEGKSTLLRLMTGQIRPQQGEIILPQEDRGLSIGYVAQTGPECELSFPITLEELAGLAFYPKLKGWKRLSPEQKQETREMLKTLGLEGKENALYGKVSGGQRRRALLAKALLGKPEMLILDEPLAGVDPSGRDEIYRLLQQKTRSRETTIVLVTHDPEEIRPYLDELWALKDGNLERM